MFGLMEKVANDMCLRPQLGLEDFPFELLTFWLQTLSFPGLVHLFVRSYLGASGLNDHSSLSTIDEKEREYHSA